MTIREIIIRCGDDAEYFSMVKKIGEVSFRTRVVTSTPAAPLRTTGPNGGVIVGGYQPKAPQDRRYTTRRTHHSWTAQQEFHAWTEAEKGRSKNAIAKEIGVTRLALNAKLAKMKKNNYQPPKNLYLATN